MARIGSVGVLVVLVAAGANAGVVIDLAPQNPGPYYGGEAFDVDVAYINEEGFDIQIRFLQFDFLMTDPALELTGPDADGDGIPEFVFELGGAIPEPIYAILPEYDLPGWAYLGTAPDPEMEVIPAVGTYDVGYFGVILPTGPGIYSADLMNADDPDPNRGALLQFGFDDPVIWTPGDGLSGGVVAFEVIPEPAGLVLLGLGMLAVCGRRTGHLPRRLARHPD